MNASVAMTRPVPAWHADAVITAAAARIEQSAEDLRMCHQVDGQWHGQHEACEAYEAEMQAVRELRALLDALRGPLPTAAAKIDRGDDGRGPYELAEDVVRQDGGASLVTLTRALGIDASRALLLLNQLERAGVLGPANDDGYREVLAA